MTECLKHFWKLCDMIWLLCSSTRTDYKLYGKWSQMCQEVTDGEDVLRLRNKWNPKRSFLTNYPKMWVLIIRKEIIWGWNTTWMKKSFYHNVRHYHFVRWFRSAPKSWRNINGKPFSWLSRFYVWSLFGACMTGKMFCPRISFKRGRFAPEFQWSKSRLIFRKSNQRIFDRFSSSHYSIRVF